MAKDRREYFKEYNKKHGDRHKKGYYHKYNQEHPERLNRGYTKGYVNGNVDEGPLAMPTKERTWYDRMFNPTFSELLYEKATDPRGDEDEDIGCHD